MSQYLFLSNTWNVFIIRNIVNINVSSFERNVNAGECEQIINLILIFQIKYFTANQSTTTIPVLDVRKTTYCQHIFIKCGEGAKNYLLQN